MNRQRDPHQDDFAAVSGVLLIMVLAVFALIGAWKLTGALFGPAPAQAHTTNTETDR